jgi:hypothetical protein
MSDRDILLKELAGAVSDSKDSLIIASVTNTLNVEIEKQKLAGRLDTSAILMKVRKTIESDMKRLFDYSSDLGEIHRKAVETACAYWDARNFGSAHPNAEETRITFLRKLVSSLINAGSALVWEVPDGSGGAAELYVLAMDKVCTVYGDMSQYPDYPNGAYKVQDAVDKDKFVVLAAEHVRRITFG